MSPKSCLLSVAGLDPSGGAGLLADIKSFESHGFHGLGVCTAITAQNHWSFESVHWVSLEQIKKQLAPLHSKYSIRGVKVGLVQSAMLEELIAHLRHLWPTVPIVWDPILKASAGFEFHRSIQAEKLRHLCRSIDVITPNVAEAVKLSPRSEWEIFIKELSYVCSVIVTSEKQTGEYLIDGLYENGEKTTTMHQVILNAEKHGSGCVFSSALTAGLGRVMPLSAAYENALDFTRKFLASDTSLVGKVPKASPSFTGVFSN